MKLFKINQSGSRRKTGHAGCARISLRTSLVVTQRLARVSSATQQSKPGYEYTAAAVPVSWPHSSGGAPLLRRGLVRPLHACEVVSGIAFRCRRVVRYVGSGSEQTAVMASASISRRAFPRATRNTTSELTRTGGAWNRVQVGHAGMRWWYRLTPVGLRTELL